MTRTPSSTTMFSVVLTAFAFTLGGCTEAAPFALSTTSQSQATFSGCEAPDRSSPLLQPFASHLVDPVLTDASITPQFKETTSGTVVEKHHLIVVPTGSYTKGLLYVHMGGSGGKPTNSSNIVNAAAASGYHAINLAYINDVKVRDHCLGLDDTCEELVREELVYGDLQPDVNDTLDANGDVVRPAWMPIDVDEADGIVNRLTALLLHLRDDLGQTVFGDYLTVDDTPLWANIVLSGFSQGGGQAGILSRDHDVARVLFFSKGVGAVDDGTGSPIPAPWVDDPRATSGDKSYAIVHRNEDAALYSPDAWEQWGLGDPALTVDADSVDPTLAEPFGCTHLISTAEDPKKGDVLKKAHASIGVNAFQPVQTPGDGLPLMLDAWLYMMNAEL